MNRENFKYIITLFLAFLCIPKYSFTTNSVQNILYLNSYHNGYYWSDGITQGIKTTLKNSPKINLFIEYLDAKNDSSFSKDPLYLELFNLKYDHKKIDLIITSDNDALDFVKKNQKQTVFNNKPVIACGISDPENYSDMSLLYVVKEITSFEETFELMDSFIPGLDTIFFVTDRLRSGLIYKQETMEIVSKKFPNIALSFIDCFDLNTLGNIIRLIDFPSAVFYSSASADCYGNPINELEVAKVIIKNATVPLFSGYYATVTDGFIGGCLTTGEQMGKISSKIALQLLSENNQESIKKLTIPDVINIFDYRNLQKYSIPDIKIPAESIILNKPVSIWEKNKKVLIISGIIILQLIIVIFFLSRSILIQKKYRKHIIQAMNKANESDRLKNIFLENVSHEMRTPLNSIVGFSDLLIERIEESEMKVYATIISENALSLNHMISHVFNFSLLKSHSFELKPINLKLDKLFSNVIEKVKIEKKYDKKTVEIIFEPDNDNLNLEIITDENKIFEVVKQLIDNALKFTSKGYIKIGFTLENENGPIVPKELLFILKPPYILVHIKDTGKGIEPEFLKLIFEPFRQVDEKDVDANRGLGLGLSISKSIIEILGGHIWVYSIPNEGSSFYFTLPLNNNSFVEKRT